MFRRQLLARRIIAAAFVLMLCLPVAHAARLDQTTIANGVVSLDFTGTDAGQGNSNLRLTAMGRWLDSRVADRYTIWRLRNSGTTPREVRLEGYLTGFGVALTLRPRSDTYVRSPIVEGTATHRLYEGATRIASVNAASGSWNSATPVPVGAGPNRAPVFLDVPPAVAQVAELYRHAPLVEDPDGDLVTLSAPSAPAGYAYDAVAASFRFLATAAQVGSHPVTLRADDGRGGIASQAQVLRVHEDFCPLLPIALPKSRVGAATPGQSFTNLAGGGGANQFGWATWTGSTALATLATSLVAPGDSQTYVNPDNAADHRFDVTDWVPAIAGSVDTPAVRDSLTALLQREVVVPEWRETRTRAGGTDFWITRFIRVQLTGFDLNGAGTLSFTYHGPADCYADPPVAVDQALSTPRDTALDFTLSAFDPEGDALTWYVTQDPAHGTLTGTAPALRYTPAPGYVGSDRLLFKVLADGLRSETGEVVITVTEPAGGNQPPVAHAQDLGVAEDGSLPITLTGSDPDANPLAYALLSQPAHGTLTGTAPNLQYVPAANFHGGDEFGFRVDDGQAQSPPALVRITVAPVNDPPHLTSTAPATAAAGTPYTYAATAVDIDGDTLGYALIASPQGMGIDVATGLVSWTPLATQAGSHAVTLRVVDGQGGEDTQDFTVSVPASNGPPRITSTPVVSVAESASYAYDLDAVDPDAGDELAYTLDHAPASAAIVQGSGLIGWTAAPGLQSGVRTANAMCRVAATETGTFQPRVKWQWSGYPVLSSPAIAPLRDTNGDGRIDTGDDSAVVAVRWYEDCARTSVHALDGKTGAELWSFGGLGGIGAGSHVAIGDIDADGSPEVIALLAEGGVVALTAAGRIKWTSVEPKQSSCYVQGAPTIADLEGDGQAEILVRGAVLNSDGSLRSLRPNLWHAIIDTAVDLDGDGIQEVLMLDGTSAVRFDPATGGPIASPNVLATDVDPDRLVVGDFDGDGIDDVVVVHVAAPNRLFRGSPTGFIDQSAALPGETVATGDVAIGDWNGDGAPDLIVARRTLASNELGRVYLADGHGAFVRGDALLSNQTRAVGVARIVAADVDEDGRAEVFVHVATTFGVGAQARVEVFEAAGVDGRAFEVPPHTAGVDGLSPFAGGYAPQFVDLDGDRDLDALGQELRVNGLRDIVFRNRARLGETVTLGVVDRAYAAGESAIVVLSIAPSNVQLPGLGVGLVDPSLALLASTGVANASGMPQVAFPLPAVPFVGVLPLYAQAVLVDGNGAVRALTTRAQASTW